MDVYICLLLSVLVALGTGKAAEYMAENAYIKELETHKAADGEIGGRADETVFQAQNVEDLLSHDTFTIVSPGIRYRNEGAGYYNGNYLYSVELPSGERIAACINTESVRQTGDDMYTGDSILPLGQVVWEDLSKDEGFLNQIEYHDALSRTDFYVDMVGDTAVMNEEQALETPKMIVQVLTVLVCYPIFHTIGSAFGIFPRYFPLGKKKKSRTKAKKEC